MELRNILYRLFVLVLATLMIISGFFVVRHVVDAVQQRAAYGELAALLEEARSEAVSATEPAGITAEPVVSQSPDELQPTEPVILPEYQPLFDRNNDMVGWMTIAGTPINYPVMQTPDRPDYYLKRNFNGERNAHGCLYARESCDVFTPSDNVTVYGHHMRDGSMFASLEKFRSQSFWEEHHTISFDTLYERRTYTIFAVFATTASIGRGFSYHLFENAADEADFDDFIENCLELSLIDSGIIPKYGDKIICLSTCEYTQVNGRLVVAAVLDTE